MKHLTFLFFIFSLTISSHAHEGHINENMSQAAQVLLQSLDSKLKKKISYPILASERENWHFHPLPFEGEGMRKGLSLKDMRPDQRHLAYGLLASGLSHRGFLSVTQIMSLERVLWELQNQDPRRDSMMYYITIFGSPKDLNWGWRFEGHHISLNFTIANGTLVSGTPHFLATNPGKILEGPRKGLQVLEKEENSARQLIQSFSEHQLKKVLISEQAPEEYLTFVDKNVSHLGQEGILFTDLNPHQQYQLTNLIKIYVTRLHHDFATEKLLQIKEAGHENLIFTWAGGTLPGEGHYYRIQGPTFLIEYANTRNDANHVHCVWRDFDGDFGRDVLREHYQTEH